MRAPVECRDLADPSQQSHARKIAYLEGLRGVAAIQVVLLHFVIGFLPDVAAQAPPLIDVLWDGHTAVYVFFLISGAVLTPSFERGGVWPRQAAKRFFRLAIPVAAAAFIAVLLVAALPDAHDRAARLTGSDWLAMDSSAAPTSLHLLREITLDSVLLGFREYTLFAPIADRLPLLEHALNAPTWSLHLELYGSLLLLGLVKLRARSVRPYVAAVAACAILFGTHPMFLFVIGHLFVPLIGRRPRPWVGAGLLGLGLALSGIKDWWVVDIARVAVARVTANEVPNLYQFQCQLAAVALFAGVLLSPLARRSLSLCSGLGRLSFSIYLLHFPLLFTAACAGFIALSGAMPQRAAVAVTFIVFMSCVLVAADGFERVVDRNAVRLSRRLDRKR